MRAHDPVRHPWDRPESPARPARAALMVPAVARVEVPATAPPAIQPVTAPQATLPETAPPATLPASTAVRVSARRSPARRPRAALLSALCGGMLASVLAGCSVPLLPMPPHPAAANPAPAPAPAPAPPVPAANPAPPPAADGPADEVTAPAPADQPPYGPAVAARFPDPLVSYATPAFEPGHAGFTSNDELAALLRQFERPAGGGAPTVRLLSLGSSQLGLPIEALLFTRSAETDAPALLRDGRPTVLLVGQQHGDEPAGAEALIVICQQLAQGPLRSLLDRINVIVLPRANPDGAAGQRRVTAGGIDANRDHLLLRTPEAQAQALLVRDYRPMVVVDAHEYTVVGRYLQKFGAVQRYDALLQYAMTANVPEFITRAAEEWFRRPLLAALKAQGLSAEWYYTTSADPADRKVSMGGTQPDTGRNVNGLKNAVSLLIETRGVGLGRLHLARRVHTHVTAIASVLRSTADRAADLGKLRPFVDNEVASLACKGEMVVEAAATPSEYTLRMLDPATGADKPMTVTWDSALELQVLKRRTRPCGYWLSAGQTDAVTRLRGLGVTVLSADENGVVRGETYRETARATAARADVRGRIDDAGDVLRVQVDTVPTLMDVPQGSYYVRWTSRWPTWWSPRSSRTRRAATWRTASSSRCRPRRG